MGLQLRVPPVVSPNPQSLGEPTGRVWEGGESTDTFSVASSLLPLVLLVSLLMVSTFKGARSGGGVGIGIERGWASSAAALASASFFLSGSTSSLASFAWSWSFIRASSRSLFSSSAVSRSFSVISLRRISRYKQLSELVRGDQETILTSSFSFTSRSSFSRCRRSRNLCSFNTQAMTSLAAGPGFDLFFKRSVEVQIG